MNRQTRLNKVLNISYFAEKMSAINLTAAVMISVFPQREELSCTNCEGMQTSNFKNQKSSVKKINACGYLNDDEDIFRKISRRVLYFSLESFRLKGWPKQRANLLI